MSFASAVDHLHALGLELAPSPDPTVPRRKFDLDHMRILARALGDPQKQFPSVLIAGTNGKGSTAATLSSILAAAGLRTGLYTSPHLTRVTERIRVAGPSNTSCHPERSAQHGIEETALSLSKGSAVLLECHPERSAKRAVEGPAAVLECHPERSAQRAVEGSAVVSECHPERSAQREVEGPAVVLECHPERSAKRTVEGPAVVLECHPERSAQRAVEGPAVASPTTFAEIPEDDFARLYFQVDEAANRLVSAGQLPHHPSFFETLTALAFLFFAEQEIDIAILEVGLGGRLDATNIVEPILSVITDIALDHQEYLGNTLSAIAREKSGILRANGTLITLPQHPEANQAIGEAAIALNVRAISAAPYLPDRNALLARDSQPSIHHLSQNAVILSETPERAAGESDGAQPKDPELAAASSLSALPSTPLLPGLVAQSHRNTSGVAAPPLPPNHYDLNINGERIHVRSPLAGEHQRRNIALAITAAIELRNYFGIKSTSPRTIRNQNSNESQNLAPRTANRELSIASIERGIAQTDWPGRLEFLPPNLLLDVAHNPAGAWTLRAAIASLPETVAQGLSLGSPRTLIFSCLRDKDLREMAQILFPLFDSSSPDTRTANLILCPINSPRAASLDSLLAAARDLDIPAHPAQDPAEALTLARALTPTNGLILATGSIYLIGALRDTEAEL
jgi:dihydrofolate synthase / folylpolyglutamate synthase